MEETPTNYHIEIQVRDENGKILKSKSKGLPEPRLQCEVTAKDDSQLEHMMKRMATVMRAWIPTGYSINMEASVYMNVSGDGYYMSMFSFYEGENRFVKH